MKFIDLYSGIGGFRYALEELGHECVFSAEKDKDAVDTYFKNFPSHNPFFDMDIIPNLSNKEIDELIPNHEILTAGFPCQPFSIGGNKKGFNEARGTQFFNILRILEVKKPKFILLENVENIVHHDDGKTFIFIKESLKKLDYKIQSKPVIISPHELNIPQRRKRAFFYAEKGQEEIPIPSLKPMKTKKIIINGYGEILDKYYLKVINAWQEFVNITETVNEKKIPDIWLDEMLSGEEGDENTPIWKVKYYQNMKIFYLKNKDKIDKWAIKWDVLNFKRRERKFEWRAGKTNNNFQEKILMFRTSGLRIMDNKIFPTLVAMAQTPIFWDYKLNNYRHLTVKEVSKLQSFPDSFIPHEKENVAMKHFGNSVNIYVVKELSKTFIK